MYNCHFCKLDFHAKEALDIHLVGQHNTSLESYAMVNPGFQTTRVFDKCELCGRDVADLSKHLERGICTVMGATMEFYFLKLLLRAEDMMVWNKEGAETDKMIEAKVEVVIGHDLNEASNVKMETESAHGDLDKNEGDIKDGAGVWSGRNRKDADLHLLDVNIEDEIDEECEDEFDDFDTFPNQDFAGEGTVANLLKTKGELTRRATAKHSGGEHECPVCHLVFRRKYTMLKHKEAKHDSQPLGCEDCSSTFELRCDLNQHMKSVHNKEPPKIFACSQCDLKFSLKSRLDFHRHKEHAVKRREIESTDAVDKRFR